jgi:L-threonylcarbamoyladenylate synthase
VAGAVSPGLGPGPVAGLEDAAAALRAGLVVGVPTDTVYGLAADPTRPGATDRLFSLKARPATAGLPVLVADIAQAERFAEMSAPARRLAQRFWPGGLTIVVARRAGVDWSLGGDGRTVGVRCPAHELTRALCALVGPLATTSANLHGEAPLTEAGAVRDAFGAAIACVVDGGRCAGEPSTVVDVTPGTPRCLRPGAVSWEDVTAALGG